MIGLSSSNAAYPAALGLLHVSLGQLVSITSHVMVTLTRNLKFNLVLSPVVLFGWTSLLKSNEPVSKARSIRVNHKNKSSN